MLASQPPIVPVSVVIPCYRCAKTIDRAVESVVHQTAKPQQVILVDDGSCDDTWAALRRLQQRIGKDRIEIISLDTNQGTSVARNVGWDAARGEFVAFLDADDAWHPRKLELQVAFMQRNPDVDLCGHRSRTLQSEASPEHVEPAVGARPVTFSQLLFSNRFITPSAMLRRTVPLRFHPGRRYMEDHLLWMQLAAGGAKIFRLDGILAYTFKPPYGTTGLSGKLWEMEKAELSNYLTLAEGGAIRHVAAIVFCLLSIFKFAKRVIVVACRTPFLGFLGHSF